MKRPVTEKLFKVIVKPNSKAQKVLFYLTSYASSWRIYSIPITRFRRLGYEVVVYDFHNQIIENDDPHILLGATQEIIDDMYQRQQAYEARGIEIFHGIGNSLGSFMLYNFTLKHAMPAIILNGGGEIAEVIFHNKSGSWKSVADAYLAKGYGLQKLKQLWASIDEPERAQNIKVEKVLLMWSFKDGVIPNSSCEAFEAAIKKSGKQILVKNDNLPHAKSVLRNSLKVKTLYNFLNTP